MQPLIDSLPYLLGGGSLFTLLGCWCFGAYRYRYVLGVGDLVGRMDSMSGVEFEYAIADLMRKDGYSVRMTPATGDLGVDLVASRDRVSIALQLKCYANPVDRKAVSDVVAGMAYYRCTTAAVVTNNIFTPGAVKLAQANQCRLIDRRALSHWIAKVNASKVNPRLRRGGIWVVTATSDFLYEKLGSGIVAWHILSFIAKAMANGSSPSTRRIRRRR